MRSIYSIENVSCFYGFFVVGELLDLKSFRLEPVAYFVGAGRGGMKRREISGRSTPITTAARVIVFICPRRTPRAANAAGIVTPSSKEITTLHCDPSSL